MHPQGYCLVLSSMKLVGKYGVVKEFLPVCMALLVEITSYLRLGAL